MKITPVEPPCKLGWLDVKLPDEAIDKLNDYVSKASKTQPPSLTVPYSKDNPMAWEKSMKDEWDMLIKESPELAEFDVEQILKREDCCKSISLVG